MIHKKVLQPEQLKEMAQEIEAHLDTLNPDNVHRVPLSSTIHYSIIVADFKVHTETYFSNTPV